MDPRFLCHLQVSCCGITGPRSSVHPGLRDRPSYSLPLHAKCSIPQATEHHLTRSQTELRWCMSASNPNTRTHANPGWALNAPSSNNGSNKGCQDDMIINVYSGAFDVNSASAPCKMYTSTEASSARVKKRGGEAWNATRCCKHSQRCSPPLYPGG